MCISAIIILSIKAGFFPAKGVSFRKVELMNYPNKVTAVMSRPTAKGELLRKLAAKPNQRVDVDEKLNKWSVATAYTPKDILLMLEIVENQEMACAAA